VPVTYTVTGFVDVNDSLTCQDSDTIRVLLQEVNVYIPNAFTPNGDGRNDVFLIYGWGFKNFSLKIYDRWGEKLFETTNPNVGWDGTYRGKALNPGVYVYHADIEFIDKSKPDEYIQHWKGSVTLIR
jgi:gliding motility-associated-like protein